MRPIPNPSFNLSLLEEAGNGDFVKDLLNTFLTNLPGQMAELQDASDSKDFERLYFISHRLKGSTAMMQAGDLIQHLNKIEEIAKKKADASGTVEATKLLFDELARQLEEKKAYYENISGRR